MIAILPDILQPYVTLPYKTYANAISTKEVASIQPLLGDDNKHVVLFIGGFCDSLCKAMFNYFMIALQQGYSIKDKNTDIDNAMSGYLSFNCHAFLRDLLPRLLDNAYNIYIISHSWGAKNAIMASLADNMSINALITLDCVAHFDITHRPSNILMWENIYIESRKISNISNIVSIIGGVKGRIDIADTNIALLPPVAHDSVHAMLTKSHIFTLHKKDKF